MNSKEKIIFLPICVASGIVVGLILSITGVFNDVGEGRALGIPTGALVGGIADFISNKCIWKTY